MPQIQDSTHGRGIADLRRAAAICRSLAGRYTPADPLIEVAALEDFCDQCANGLDGLYGSERAFNEARAARKEAFDGLDTWGTQLANNLKSSKASDRTVKEARDLVKKIRGERQQREPDSAASDTPAAEVQQQITVAQTTFSNRLDHSRKLLRLAEDLGAAYRPAAEEMKPEALRARLARMEAANRAVDHSAAAYSNALIGRDRLLYDAQSGAPARMDALRTWFQSAFGAGSAERKLLNGLSVQSLANKRLQAV